MITGLWKKMSLVCIMMALVLLGACNSKDAAAFNGGEEIVSTETPAPTDAPTETPTPTSTPAPTEEPTPEPTSAPPNIIQAKGVYITGPMAGSNYFNSRYELVKTTDLNAMVIDVKDDVGCVMFKGMKLQDEIDLSVNNIPDVKSFLADLHENGVYAIARIVCFKDNGIVDTRPDFAIPLPNGEIYREDKTSKLAWLNPYNREVWDYLLDVAYFAAEVGFDEIQLDYIRFPTDRTIRQVEFTDELTGGVSKTEIIAQFASYFVEKMHEKSIPVSADLYGAALYSDIDAELIGQDFVELAGIFDAVSPMLYPSHYDVAFDISQPDFHPYEIINETLKAAFRRLEARYGANADVAQIRPWIQDFTATYNGAGNYQVYGGEQVADEIRACNDNGIDEWLLWDARNEFNGYRELVGQSYE